MAERENGQKQKQILPPRCFKDTIRGLKVPACIGIGLSGLALLAIFGAAKAQDAPSSPLPVPLPLSLRIEDMQDFLYSHAQELVPGQTSSDVVQDISSLPFQTAQELPIRDDALPIPTQLLDPEQSYGFQNEVDLAVCPENPKKMAATWNNAVRPIVSPPYPRDFDLRIITSEDGGETWAKFTVPGFPTEGGDESQGDGVMAYKKDPLNPSQDCRLTWSGLSFNRAGNSNYGGTVVVSSNDNGQTWEDPIIVDQSGENTFDTDKNWIAANPENGEMTLVWGRVMPGNRRWDLVYGISTDGGRNWGEIKRLDPNPPHQYNVMAHPKYLPDGTLSISAFSMGSGGKTDVMFYRQEPDGSMSRSIVARDLDYLYYAGMPEVVQGEDGVLRLFFGDQKHILYAESRDSGDTWSSLNSFASLQDPDDRWWMALPAVDPAGKTVVCSYYYRHGPKTTQLHCGALGGEGMFAVGDQDTIVGDITDWGDHRQQFGDYNRVQSNFHPDHPGVHIGFTTIEPGSSNPPGYVPGTNNNATFATVLTSPNVHFSPVSDVFRPVGEKAEPTTQTLTLTNEGITTENYTVSTSSFPPVVCEGTVTVGDPSITVPARGSTAVDISTVFHDWPEGRGVSPEEIPEDPATCENIITFQPESGGKSIVIGYQSHRNPHHTFLPSILR